jgi:hypothetical protein
MVRGTGRNKWFTRLVVAAAIVKATDRLSLGRWRLFDDIGTDLACHPVLVADGAAAADRADHFQLLLLKGQDIQ